MKFSTFKLSVIGAALMSISLTSTACFEEEFDPYVEDRLTVSQGIYGQTTSHDDIGYNPVVVNSDFTVLAYTSEPPQNLDGAQPFASDVSDERGFYELSLQPGEYWICTTFGRCIQLDLGTELLRLDYEFGAGPGWSVPVSGE